MGGWSEVSGKTFMFGLVAQIFWADFSDRSFLGLTSPLLASCVSL